MKQTNSASASELFAPKAALGSFLLPIGGVTGDPATDAVLVVLDMVKHLDDFAPRNAPKRPDDLPDDEELYKIRRRNMHEAIKSDASTMRLYGFWSYAVIDVEGINAKRLAGLAFVADLVKHMEGAEPEQARAQIVAFAKQLYGVDIEMLSTRAHERKREIERKTWRLDVLPAWVRHFERPPRKERDA